MKTKTTEAMLSLLCCLGLLLTASCGGSGGGGGGATPAANPGAQLKVSAKAMSLDPQGTVLDKPITVEMPYSPNDLTELGLSAPSDLLVYKYDRTADSWEQVSGATVDSAKGVVMFSTDNLTLYRFAAETQ